MMENFRNDLTACRGDMLKRFYLKKYHAADRKRRDRLKRIQTLSEAQQYIAEIRAKLSRSFGTLPQALPNDVQRTGRLATKKLLIDKVLYQSRPGYFISALFYRPAICSGKLPGILFLCGHSRAGKAEETYQRVSQSLALRGFGVLAVDPYGQGERLEFGGGPVTEHNRFGYRLGLLGEFFGAWRLHDALVSLEYLKSRPEIDASRLGATGCSGGGTLTSYLNAFSKDLMMAAPVCSMTLLSSNLENEISADCEQNPPGFRKYGLDEGDFLIASAPRPVLLGVQDNDFFDPAGTEKLHQEVRRIYRLFNAENQLIFSLGHGDHSYAECQQHAVGKFFSSLAESHPAGDDGDIQIFEESELYCTPEGSVWQLSGSKSTGRILSDLMRKRPVMSKTDPRDFWRNSLHLKKPCIPCFSRGFQQYIAPLKLHACRFLLRTEPGIEITLKKISSRVEHCLHCQNKARLLIPRIDGIREMAENNILTDHEDFFILEIRGIGESLPCRPECDLLSVYRQLYPACALMSGESLLEGQVRDILCTLLLLKRCGLREVTLEADGVMRIPAALAALFSPVPAEAVRKAIPDFWMEYLMNPQVEMPYELLPFGILQYAHPFESH